MTSIAVRRLTVRDYHRMAEIGIFSADERVELLDGNLISMAAKGTARCSATARTRRIVEAGLGGRVLVRVRDPVQLDDYSEPEPDIAIVALEPLEYADRHPKPSEIFLLIEVADTSLAFDLGAKALAYACSGIPDYWVLDVQFRKLYVLRSPTVRGYQSEAILEETMQIAPLAFPDCTLETRGMLPLMAG
ncbi:Uma2 family endonuclease [Altericista sp. CCNU0014]|uniref:Uma2 family endonuclease n=1 Tax=Altericista sp. CCNU0014 TaxID=3082949 RepID=UPI00384E12A1